MKKALYIIEFSCSHNENETEWFVANDDLSYSDQEIEGYKHLMESMGGESIIETVGLNSISNVYKVDKDIILEVANSYKDSTK